MSEKNKSIKFVEVDSIDIEYSSARKSEDEWKAEEISTFYNLVKEHGRDFKKIQQGLRNKTYDAVRNFYYTELKKIKQVLNAEEIKREQQQVLALILWWEFVVSCSLEGKELDKPLEVFSNAFRQAIQEMSKTQSRHVEKANTPEAITGDKMPDSKKRKTESSPPPQAPVETQSNLQAKTSTPTKPNVIEQSTTQNWNQHKSTSPQSVGGRTETLPITTTIPQASRMDPYMSVTYPVGTYIPNIMQGIGDDRNRKWIFSVHIFPFPSQAISHCIRFSADPIKKVGDFLDIVILRAAKIGITLPKSELRVFVRSKEIAKELYYEAEVDMDDLLGDVVELVERDRIVVRRMPTK